MSDEILSLYESLLEKATEDIDCGIVLDRKMFHTKFFNYIRALDKESSVMGQRVIGMLIYIHYESTKPSQSDREVPYEGRGNVKNKSIDFDSKKFPDELIHILCLYLDSKLE